MRAARFVFASSLTVLAWALSLSGCGGGSASMSQDGGTCDPACSGVTPYCDAAHQRCVVCRDDKDCGAGTICGTKDGAPACVKACKSDDDCPAGNSCCDRSCVDVQSDSVNCGACGNACPIPDNGKASCEAGQCGLDSCNPGYKDCDQDLSNGCEAHTDNDAQSCGACGNACPIPAQADATCTDGVCGIGQCLPNYGDCDGNAQNGCETLLAGSDVMNCGACGHACLASHNAAATCTSGVCGVGACESGWADCDGNAANGCETQTNGNDVNHCGSCGACGAVAGGSPTCNAGTCAAACASGFADCDHIYGNGCEVNLQTSAANCGMCGKACNFANGSGACSGGACALMACNTNYASCDGNDANGCEANLQTDKSHCGDCDVACASDQVCSSGVCKAGKLKVLLVQADEDSFTNDVQMKLQNTGAFSAVDRFDARALTPTVAELQPYDVVLVWSNYAFADSTQLGDNLADYFDGGGQVVVAAHALAGSPASLLGGRFGTPSGGYILLTPADKETSPASLGTVYEPDSPLLDGVYTLSANVASRGQGAVVNGGVVVADWNGSPAYPLIVRGVVAGRKRVDLNLFPVSSDSVPRSWTGDGTTILKNALLYR